MFRKSNDTGSAWLRSHETEHDTHTTSHKPSGMIYYYVARDEAEQFAQKMRAEAAAASTAYNAGKKGEAHDHSVAKKKAQAQMQVQSIN